MNVDQPKSTVAGILCVILWISFVISSAKTKAIPSLLLWIICCLNKDMLKAIKKFIKVVIFATILLSIVTFARIIGGTHISLAIEHSLRVLGLLSTLGITIIILTNSVESLEWLRFFELIHLPRGLIYILLATGSSLSLVSDHGGRSIVLLKLKGYRMNTILSKFGAYIRIVAPAFSVLLKDMTIQANSLYYRGFLKKPLYRMEFEAYSRRNQMLWIMSTICTLLIGVFLMLWI